MAESPERKEQRNSKVGCSFAIAICLITTFVLVTTIRSCLSPVREAKRLIASDPCRASSKLADQVRADQRPTSYDALQLLVKIQHPCALRELVNLLDLPDGRWTSYHDREEIWAAIKSRVGSTSGMPTYDPRGSPELRSQQKQLWISLLNQRS
jgi:hypothetical protein